LNVDTLKFLELKDLDV